jgi:hypothetical protein
VIGITTSRFGGLRCLPRAKQEPRLLDLLPRAPLANRIRGAGGLGKMRPAQVEVILTGTNLFQQRCPLDGGWKREQSTSQIAALPSPDARCWLIGALVFGIITGALSLQHRARHRAARAGHAERLDSPKSLNAWTPRNRKQATRNNADAARGDATHGNEVFPVQRE